MNATRWTRSIALAVSVVALCAPVLAQSIQLAKWDTPPTGSVFPGGDFDPTLDNMASCSGCWSSRTAASGVTYAQSTSNGVTQGTGALEATIVGRGAGGEYTATINGTGVGLDTHFDYPLLVTYSNNPNANGGVLDPRYTALYDAVSGNQGLYSIEFDIVYDVAQMRSIPWQPPEETVDPENNGQYPQRFFWIGMHGNMSNDADGSGFIFTGFDDNTINPFDEQWDNNLFPVFPASFPLSDFEFNVDPDNPPTFFQFGMLYNSVFGTLPAAANTHGVRIYFDNFRLVERDILGPIDFNNNGMADLGDFELFMAQHRTATPTLGDFDMDGDNDFIDFQQFEEFYDLATGGAGSLRAALAAVPEPGTIALLGLAVLALVAVRTRRSSRTTMLAGGLACLLVGQPATAQVVETWTTLGNWVPNPGAPAQAAPSLALSSIGATEGTTSLKITQADDTIGDNDFVWMATTSPNWTAGDPAFEALRNAVNLGAEHFNVLLDVTFHPQDLADQGVNTLSVTFGLNFAGQTAAIYAGETQQFTTTAILPLSAFDLPDVEDEGATGYSSQFGFTADALGGFPFSAYVDNIRLEQISTPDLLTLEIDRSNGSATLKNLTGNPISWDYSEIKSPGGSLNPSGWNSLDDQNAGGSGTWIEAGGSSATELVEASLLGSHTLMPTETLSLGNLYNTAVNAEDVDFEIRRAAGPSHRTFDQIVTYIGEPVDLLGDYNGDGSVDAADYVVWRKSGGSPDEYNTWRANFGRSLGQSGLAGGTAIPEPSAAVLLLSTAVGLLKLLDRRGA